MYLRKNVENTSICTILLSWCYMSVHRRGYPRTQVLQARRKGLVHTARACAGMSIATDCVTIVITHGFYMTCSSMDNKWRVYNRLSQFLLGSPDACACNVCQGPFFSFSKGLGTKLYTLGGCISQ
jgi:hypothetical protein